jgi:PIN domain nuclease of toxin-antitoxin system
MRLLLDAHALLWWLAGDQRLADTARRQIEHPDSEAFASVAVIWEIEIKRAAGRLQSPADLVDTLDALGVDILRIEARHAVAAARLPRHHGDPFDRMQVAQSALEGLTLVTRDERLGIYDVPILLA